MESRKDIPNFFQIRQLVFPPFLWLPFLFFPLPKQHKFFCGESLISNALQQFVLIFLSFLCSWELRRHGILFQNFPVALLILANLVFLLA